MPAKRFPKVSAKLAAALHRARERGRADALKGVPRTSPPYRAYELRTSWLFGFDAAGSEAPLFTTTAQQKVS